MSAALQTRALNAFYGDAQALFGIDFELGAGEMVAIIGANGAGKSTFMKSITGLVTVAPEQIRFDGEAIGGLAPIVVKEIYDAMPAICAEGMTVAIVEQDVALAQRVSQRVYCFQEGRVSLQGASATLTREQITKAYFG